MYVISTQLVQDLVAFLARCQYRDAADIGRLIQALSTLTPAPAAPAVPPGSDKE